jgi:hypothetical protein
MKNIKLDKALCLPKLILSGTVVSSLDRRASNPVNPQMLNREFLTSIPELGEILIGYCWQQYLPRLSTGEVMAPAAVGPSGNKLFHPLQVGTSVGYTVQFWRLGGILQWQCFEMVQRNKVLLFVPVSHEPSQTSMILMPKYWFYSDSEANSTTDIQISVVMWKKKLGTLYVSVSGGRNDSITCSRTKNEQTEERWTVLHHVMKNMKNSFYCRFILQETSSYLMVDKSNPQDYWIAQYTWWWGHILLLTFCKGQAVLQHLSIHIISNINERFWFQKLFPFQDR